MRIKVRKSGFKRDLTGKYGWINSMDIAVLIVVEILLVILIELFASMVTER